MELRLGQGVQLAARGILAFCVFLLLLLCNGPLACARVLSNNLSVSLVVGINDTYKRTIRARRSIYMYA
jgi:hypothetical protein